MIKIQPAAEERCWRDPYAWSLQAAAVRISSTLPTWHDLKVKNVSCSSQIPAPHTGLLLLFTSSLHLVENHRLSVTPAQQRVTAYPVSLSILLLKKGKSHLLMEQQMFCNKQPPKIGVGWGVVYRYLCWFPKNEMHQKMWDLSAESKESVYQCI